MDVTQGLRPWPPPTPAPAPGGDGGGGGTAVALGPTPHRGGQEIWSPTYTGQCMSGCVGRWVVGECFIV